MANQATEVKANSSSYTYLPSDDDWSTAARECRRRYQRQYWERRAKKERVENYHIIESIYNSPEVDETEGEPLTAKLKRLSEENIRLSQKVFAYEQFIKQISAITKDAEVVNQKF